MKAKRHLGPRTAREDAFEKKRHREALNSMDRGENTKKVCEKKKQIVFCSTDRGPDSNTNYLSLSRNTVICDCCGLRQHACASECCKHAPQVSQTG